MRQKIKQYCSYGGRDICTIGASLILLAVLFIVGVMIVASGTGYYPVVLVLVAGLLWFSIVALLLLVLRRILAEHSATDWRALAEFDPLTQVANRRGFLNARAWSRTPSYRAVVMIDVDDFKSINDTYGHDAGDEVLCRLAKRLQQLTRQDDILCRWGGDEFVVVLDNADQRGAEAFVRRLVTTLSEPECSQNSPALPIITVTAGVALVNADSDVQAAIVTADRKLLHNKRNGRMF